MSLAPEIDERLISEITERVVAALRDELEAIAMNLVADGSSQVLTVGEVAERFGVARSTVYSHWREWGGYKLGGGDRAAIRFPAAAVTQEPPAGPTTALRQQPAPKRQRGRRRDRTVLRGEPRLPSEFDVEPTDPVTLRRGTRGRAGELPA